MPMFKIYVGNLDPRVKIEQVRELFSPFMTIEDAVLVADTKSGKPKGFAIVMVRDPEIGRAAVKATQGKRLLGKTLTINEVMKKGQAAAKAAKETRQGPFGPHFNRQGGGRAGAVRGGPRRGVNRGPRGTSFGSGAPGSFGSGLGSGGSFQPRTGGGSGGPIGGAPGIGGPTGGGPGSFGSRPSDSGYSGSPRPPQGDARPPMRAVRRNDDGPSAGGASGGSPDGSDPRPGETPR